MTDTHAPTAPTRHLPSQLQQVPAPPKTVAEAVAHMHQNSVMMRDTLQRLERVLHITDRPPDLYTVVINPAASVNGPFVAINRVRDESQSVGILNTGAQPVSIGIAGVSTAANSLAPQCPASAALVLPIRAGDLEFGVPAALGANQYVIYVFRYRTPQPLLLSNA